MFKLSRDLRHALELLHCRLMPMQRRLDGLHRSALALRQFLQLHCVLLLLLQHLLVHHRGLTGLLLQLAHRLFDFANLLTDVVVH